MIKVDTDIVLRKKRLCQVIGGIEVAVFCAILVSFSTMEMSSTLLLVGFAVLFALALLLIKHNKVEFAANYVVFVTTLLMLVFIWRFEGLKDEVLLVFPALIAFAVMVGTPKLMWAVYLITVINVFGIGLLNHLGIRQQMPSSGGLISAIIIFIIFSLVTYCIVILGRDLTKALSQLRQYGDDLERQVESRTQELEKSLADLKATQNKLVESEKMASLGQLIAGVAHEMNTPAGIIFTSSSLLVDMNKKVRQQIESGALTKNDLLRYSDDASDLSQLIMKNSERTAALINDFKKVAASKDDERRSHFELVSQLKSISSAFLAIHTENTDAVNVVVQPNEDIMVFQDREAISQIFTNFIANSLLHGFDDNQGCITITVQSAQDTITVIYEDDGKGLSDDAKKRIFDPFYTTKRNQGGTGLGMHIVYNLITQSLGGSITLDEKRVRGAAFTVTFPQSRANDIS